MTFEFITFTTRFIPDSTNCHYQSMFNDFVIPGGFPLTIQIEKRYLRHTLIRLLTDFNWFRSLLLICINEENPHSHRYVAAKGRWFKAILICLYTSLWNSQNLVKLLAVNNILAVLDAFRSRVSSWKFSSISLILARNEFWIHDGATFYLEKYSQILISAMLNKLQCRLVHVCPLACFFEAYRILRNWSKLPFGSCFNNKSSFHLNAVIFSTDDMMSVPCPWREIEK